MGRACDERYFDGLVDTLREITSATHVEQSRFYETHALCSSPLRLCIPMLGFSDLKNPGLIGNSDQEWFIIVITIIYNLKLIMNFAISPYIHVSDAKDR